MCWSCGETLEGIAARERAAEPNRAEPAAQSPATDRFGTSLGRRTLAVELSVVGLLTVAAPFVGAAWAALEPVPTTLIAELWRLCHELGISGILLYLVWRDRGSLGQLGLRRTGWWKEIGAGFLLFLLVTAFWIATWEIVLALGLPVWDSDLQPIEDSPAMRALLPLFLLSSAFYEEVVFRAYLWIRLTALTGRPGLSLFACSVLFTLVHARSPAGSLQLVLFGMLFGALFWRMRSLPRLVVAHCALNLVLDYNWLLTR